MCIKLSLMAGGSTIRIRYYVTIYERLHNLQGNCVIVKNLFLRATFQLCYISADLSTIKYCPGRASFYAFTRHHARINIKGSAHAPRACLAQD